MPTDKVKAEPEDPIVLDKIAEIPAEEQPHELETNVAEATPVVQEDNIVIEVSENKAEKRTPVASSGSARTTGRIVKSPPAIAAKPVPKPVGVGAVGRSQIPKPSASKSNESSPTKAITESTRTSPTKSTTTSTITTVKSTRSTMAVVGRAKTVDLGKNTGKKTSVGELQAPRVVRQMSTGHMQPQSPNRSLPVKSNLRVPKSAESPVKKIVATSVKTDDSKKAATTTGYSMNDIHSILNIFYLKLVIQSLQMVSSRSVYWNRTWMKRQVSLKLPRTNQRQFNFNLILVY